LRMKIVITLVLLPIKYCWSYKVIDKKFCSEIFDATRRFIDLFSASSTFNNQLPLGEFKNTEGAYDKECLEALPVHP